MNKRSLIVGAVLTAILLLCVAGVKMSRITRTRNLQATSTLLVNTQAPDGRWHTRAIAAPDLATNLSQWNTNSGGVGGGGEVTTAQLNTASNVVWNSSGIYTNISLQSSNVVVVHPTANVLTNGMLLTNAVKFAGAIGGGTRPMLVRLLPGKYITPANTLPSVMTLIENVSTYWEAGAEWGSGTPAGDPAFMWDFSAKRTNCHILGSGRFWLTNDGASCVYVETSSRIFIQGLSFYATDNSGLTTANPFTWDGTAVDITFDVNYAESAVYDCIYGDVSGGQRISGRILEARAAGDIVEFGLDSPAWGLIDLEIPVWRQTSAAGQTTVMQIGGRTKVRGSQGFVTTTIGGRISDGGGTTNGILEGYTIQYPPNSGISPLSGPSGLTLKNVTIYGPTNVDMGNIASTAANPLTLDHVTLYNGWASTNWIRGASASTVRILGGLALHPYRPVGGNITLDGHIKNVPNYGAPAAGQLVWWHDSTTTTNRGAHFTGLTNSGAFRQTTDAIFTADVQIGNQLDVTTGIVTPGAGSFGDLSVINVTADRLAMFEANNTLTNVTQSDDFALVGGRLSLDTNLTSQTVQATNGIYSGGNGIAGTLYLYSGLGAQFIQTMIVGGATVLYGTNGYANSMRGVVFKPELDDTTSLGTTSDRWKGAYVKDLASVDGTLAVASNTTVFSITTTNGVLLPSNSVAMPSAASLGLGGYKLVNSNGVLVAIYTLDGTTTAMKVLVP